MAQLTWYITANPISNNDLTGNNQSGGTPNQESTDKNKNDSLKKTTTQILAVTTAKRSISYLTSNVGKWSGNTRTQTMVNNVSKLAGYGIAFAANPILGAATVALDGITNVIDTWWEQKWDRVRSEQAQARAGGKGGYRR